MISFTIKIHQLAWKKMIRNFLYSCHYFINTNLISFLITWSLILLLIRDKNRKMYDTFASWFLANTDEMDRWSIISFRAIRKNEKNFTRYVYRISIKHIQRSRIARHSYVSTKYIDTQYSRRGGTRGPIGHSPPRTSRARLASLRSLLHMR